MARHRPSVDTTKGIEMNQDILKGRWSQLKGELKTQWGKFTDNDIAQIEGQRDKLVGKVRERYGLAREDAERQVDDWLERN
jgi:uncharacterized protein YjbJ (UPF0337 family)